MSFAIDDKSYTVTSIYETIQRWLDGKITGDIRTGHLIIPVNIPGAVKELRFRRQVIMGGTSRAQSMDDDSIVIPFDPNWESLLKIQKLLTPPQKKEEKQA